MAYYLDLPRLATLIKGKRGTMGLRDCAVAIGKFGKISPSTISRIENEGIPEMETFVILCNWLEVSPATFFKDTDPSEQETTASEAIQQQLKQDENLDPNVAQVLGSLVAAAYRDLKTSNS